MYQDCLLLRRSVKLGVKDEQICSCVHQSARGSCSSKEGCGFEPRQDHHLGLPSRSSKARVPGLNLNLAAGHSAAAKERSLLWTAGLL